MIFNSISLRYSDNLVGNLRQSVAAKVASHDLGWRRGHAHLVDCARWRMNDLDRPAGRRCRGSLLRCSGYWRRNTVYPCACMARGDEPAQGAGHVAGRVACACRGFCVLGVLPERKRRYPSGRVVGTGIPGGRIFWRGRRATHFRIVAAAHLCRDADRGGRTHVVHPIKLDRSDEAQPHIIGSPIAIFVAKDRREQCRCLIDDFLLYVGRQAIEHTATEGAKPGAHAAGRERGWTRDERDLLHVKAVSRKSLRIAPRRGVVVDAILAIAEAVTLKDGPKGDADGGDVALAAHFSYKAAAGLEHAANLREHCILIANPVKSGVGEYGVEDRITERERFGVCLFSFNTPLTRRCNHVR